MKIFKRIAIKSTKWFYIFINVVRILGVRKIWRMVRSRLRKHIYPIDIPALSVEPGLDLLILDLPARSAPMVPNSLGHLYNILKSSGIRFQLLDVNVIIYHRHHMGRMLGGAGTVKTADGYVMSNDPWMPGNMAEWTKDEVLNHFWPQMDELLESISRQKPKAVGLSVHANNRIMSNRFIKAVRERIPETTIIVGGFDCIRRESAPFLIKDFDYMVIGEAELTLNPLVKALSSGEQPRDLPGIVSRWDSAERPWEAPLPDDLDAAGYPRYEWTDLSLYKTFNGDAMAPISASRGCRWSRCRFCSECFTFRKRSPKSVIEEMKFLESMGFVKMHFNESDINGDPQNLHDICSELIKHKPGVLLGGQIRIDRRNTREYFQHLAKAGVLRLIFGVDGWSDRVLRLQMKGYNMKMVFQNLRDCRKAGIYSAVNIVIGVPGETDEDIDEMIENITMCSEDIDMLGSINTLMLAAGNEYFRNPEKYKIRFRGDKEEIFRNNPAVIPVDLWYSEDPYIDQDVRISRLDRMFKEFRGRGIKFKFTSSEIKGLKIV